jgi:SNF family Na+-dependent transporter
MNQHGSWQTAFGLLRLVIGYLVIGHYLVIVSWSLVILLKGYGGWVNILENTKQ